MNLRRARKGELSGLGQQTLDHRFAMLELFAAVKLCAVGGHLREQPDQDLPLPPARVA